MSRWCAGRWCGAFSGLALLFSAPLHADDVLRDAIRKELRDESYVLVENHSGSRLYLLSAGSALDAARLVRAAGPPPVDVDMALAMTRSPDARTRVRGLTLLAAETGSMAHDAALELVFDPVAAVREEAFQLLLEHPHADVDSIAALGRADRSARVREAVEELLDEQGGD